MTSPVRELSTLAVHVVVCRPATTRPAKPRKSTRAGHTGTVRDGSTSGTQVMSSALGGRGADCKGQAGLEKCDPGSPLEEAVNDQDGATVGERGVDGGKLAPGSSSKRKRNEIEVGQPCRYCIVLLQDQQLVSLPAGPSSLPQRE